MPLILNYAKNYNLVQFYTMITTLQVKKLSQIKYGSWGNVRKICLDRHLNHFILQSKGKEHRSVTRSKLVLVFCVIYYNIYN